jgi:capsule polysaccharide export protein KpsE/RkpR
MPPDNQSSSTAALAALAAKVGPGFGGLGSDLLGIKNSGDLFVGMLRSRTVQDRIVQRFDLKERYAVRLEEDARKELVNRTGIGIDRKSGIITITTNDRSPKGAAVLARAYVEELDRLVAEVSVSSARRERMFLEDRLKTVKLDLDQASRDFSEFASKNTAVDLKEQGRAMLESAARLQGELIAAESELKGLQEIYTPNNIRVKAVEARAAELRKQLANLGGVEDLTIDRSRAVPYPSIREIPILGVRYQELYRRTKSQETVFEILTQEYELAKVQEAKETPTVKVLDEPAVPERKSFPPRTFLTILAGIIGMCCATIWVLAKAEWQEVSAERPSKILARELLTSMKASMPWALQNGSRVKALTHGIWNRFVHRH